MNGLAYRVGASVPILLAIFVVAQGRPRPHYTFILPDGYIGGVQVVFNDSQASPLPIRKDGGRVVEVPESGIPRTSDLLVRDNSPDEFFYRAATSGGTTELRPMRTEYVLPGMSHGGWDVMDTGGKGRGYSWFIFFGPPEIRAKIPWADITKVPGYGRKLMAPDVYPTPGRLAASRPQQTNPEEIISRIIDKGMLDGHDNKMVGGIGDAAAAIVTKVVRGRSLSSDEI